MRSTGTTLGSLRQKSVAGICTCIWKYMYCNQQGRRNKDVAQNGWQVQSKSWYIWAAQLVILHVRYGQERHQK